MAALVVLEVVILDVTLAISGSSVAWGGAKAGQAARCDGSVTSRDHGKRA